MPTSMRKGWRVFRSHHQSKHGKIMLRSSLKWTKGCCPWRLLSPLSPAGVFCTGLRLRRVTRHSAISLSWERHTESGEPQHGRRKLFYLKLSVRHSFAILNNLHLNKLMTYNYINLKYHMWNCRILLLNICHASTPTAFLKKPYVLWDDMTYDSWSPPHFGPLFKTVSVHDDVTPTRTGLGTHAQLEVDGIHQVGHFIIVHELGAVQDHVIHAGLREHGSWLMSPWVTSPNHEWYMVFFMATTRWCPYSSHIVAIIVHIVHPF